MPELGEIRNGRHIGYKSSNRFIWAACLGCGKARWVMLLRGKSSQDYCRDCAMKQLIGRMLGPRSPAWKGGRKTTSEGYVSVWISPDDFFYPMADRKRHRISEHRLIMAKHLGRCLHSWEIVHHKNGVRDDNHIENLELTGSVSEHSAAHSKGYKDGYSKGLEDGRLQQIQELKQEIRLLRLQMKELGAVKCN